MYRKPRQFFLVGMIVLVLLLLLVTSLLKRRDITNLEANLKNTIEHEYPQINNKSLTDFEKVNILRQWTFENVAWASDKLQVKKFIKGKEAYEIFPILLEKSSNNIGGVDCGGYAYSLMKLYKLYGYKSYTYHYGALSGWNDVVTLVQIKHNNLGITVVEQALFDSVFVTEKGEPYDFFQLLRDIRMGKGKSVKIINGEGKPHRAFCAKGDGCINEIFNSPTKKISGNNITFTSKFSPYTLYENVDSLHIPRDIQFDNDSRMDKILMMLRIIGIIKWERVS